MYVKYIKNTHEYKFSDEMTRQLLKADAKAVIAAAEIISVVHTAMRTLSPKIPFIVIDDKSSPIPEGLIHFHVSKITRNINII
jgi:hypothetical protein